MEPITLLGVPTDTITALAGVVTAIAAAVAAIFAARGVTSWRFEMVGRRRADLAERALVIAYRCRDALVDARHPVVSAGEMAPKGGEEPNVAQHSKSMPARRLLWSADIFGELQAVHYQFMAVFGSIKDDPFLELFKLRNKIIAASEALFLSRNNKFDADDQVRPHVSEAYKIAFGVDRDEEDPIRERMDAALAKIEALCRPALQARKP